MRRDKSALAFERAKVTMAGGIASSARSSDIPFYVARGEGSHIFDIDGREYIDYVCGFGPLVLGHKPKSVHSAIAEQLNKGILFGACCELEFLLAEEIVKMVPSIDMVRFGCSGSESIANVLRLARAFTGRDKIVKFEGHFHGTMDNIYVSVNPSPPLGPVNAPWSKREVAGQDADALDKVIVLPWHDLKVLEKTLQRRANEIAAVICEPLTCHPVVIPTERGFLEGLRELTAKHEVLLVFDEIITGFRLALGGAQEFYGVLPDLTVLGKGLGSGLPISAFGGRREIMELVSNETVSQSGTYNSNPLCLAGALAGLKELQKDNCRALRHMHQMGAKLREGLNRLFAKANQPIRAIGCDPVFSIISPGDTPRDYRDFLKCNQAVVLEFRRKMFDEGVWFLAKGRFYVSATHSEEDLERTLEITRKVLAS